jgi:signal transduction histidine kinase
MSKISKRLARKLSTSIILLAIPVFIMSLGIFYLQSRYLIHQKAMERSKSVLRTAIQRVSNFMNTIENSTDANAWLLEESFTPESLEAITRRVVDLNPNVIDCYVSAAPGLFPQYGQLFSVYTFNDDDSIVTVRETYYDYLNRQWYQKGMQADKAFWVEPFSEQMEGAVNYNDAVAAYCRPIRSEDGRIMGLINTEFAFSQLAKSIASTEHSYPDAYFVLLGADGRYIIHPDTTRLFRKTIYTDADPKDNADIIALGHQMTEGKQGIMHVMVNGKKCHVNYQPVPGTSWSLAMVCPESEVLAGYYRLAYVIIALILIGLLAILWLSSKVVRQTIRPIKQLLGYTQHIVDGNYDATIPQSDQPDDIGQLQNSFAAMQQALQNHMGSISQTAEEIRKQNEQRAHNMKLAEENVRKKTQFIQNLSHQMRTPINVITGFSDVLLGNITTRTKEKDKDNKYLKEDLSVVTGMMKYNAIHLKRMILMLFDSSSAGSAQKVMNDRHDEVSCNEIARECIDYTKEHFKGIKIEFSTDLSDAVHILTNHLYLMRTIRELLYNAAKFSDGEHIRMHVSEAETTVNFIVEDTGTGLPDDADELLYKPFIKIDDFSEGLGLGLPLSKRHALSLGGDLVYDRDYHNGCRFIVEMPK